MRQNNYFTLDEENIDNIEEVNVAKTKSEKPQKIKKVKSKITNKKPFFVIIACIAIILAFAFLFFVFKNKKPSYDNENENFGKQQLFVSVEMPQFTEDVMTVSPAIETYIKSDDVTSAATIYKLFKSKGAKKTYYELPVQISCRIKSMPYGVKVKSALVSVGEAEDFTDALQYEMDSTLKAKIQFLKTNTKYFYKIELEFTDGTIKNHTGTFKTADMPRILSVDGVGNMRDIGGYKTSYGKRIKQGLFLRGTGLDGVTNNKTKITEAGIETMLSVLKIKLDMDLRFPENNPENVEPLGKAVKHNYYRCYSYSEIFEKKGKTPIKNIFSDLAKEENYPVYIHCSYGSDRTGTVCFLLEALLGMNEDDLKREYYLSAIYHGGVMDDEFNQFVEGFKSYKGNNINEKVESYLISVGVKKSEIEKIREIFLG